MRRNAALLCLLTLASTVPAIGSAPAEPRSQADVAALQWFRGNTHAHTDRSDGNAGPLEVGRWYRDLGYDFVVITDHDVVTLVARIQEQLEGDDEFLVIAGEEVSASHEGRAVHLNGLGLAETIEPRGGATVSEVIAANIAAITEAGAIAQLNHPNYGWFMDADILAQAPGLSHLEILNPHPVNNSAGGGGHPSAEGLWDDLLSRGRRVYGIAADDAHDYDSFVPTVTDRGPAPRANPGHAWIVVRAARLSAEAILAAVAAGDYYCSTGVELLDYEAGSDGVSVRLSPDYRYRIAVPGELRYRTFFIGAGGATLAIDESLTPSYRIRGDEGYVRARIEASDGTLAFTQPWFVDSETSNR